MKYWLLVISFFLHALLFLLLDQASKLRYEEASLEEVIQAIGQMDQQRQIVLYAEAPEIDITNNEDTPLLSKKRQRVKEQSVASQIGETKNRSPQPKVKLSSPTKSRDQIQELTRPKKIDLNQIASLYPQSGSSTIGEKVFGNIPIGQFTALNTDEYSFYSFTERVNERIRIRWTNKVEESLRRLKRRGLLEQLPESEMTTILEVRLDRKGNYQGSTIYQSSGLSAWDRAAVFAFQDGAPFLNPPPELLEEDDLIRLRYSFSVIWHPKYASRIK